MPFLVSKTMKWNICKFLKRNLLGKSPSHTSASCRFSQVFGRGARASSRIPPVEPWVAGGEARRSVQGGLRPEADAEFLTAHLTSQPAALVLTRQGIAHAPTRRGLWVRLSQRELFQHQ